MEDAWDHTQQNDKLVHRPRNHLQSPHCCTKCNVPFTKSNRPFIMDQSTNFIWHCTLKRLAENKTECVCPTVLAHYYPTIRYYGGILSLLCVIFLYGYGYEFLSGGKRQRREILHACWPTIRTGLLPLVNFGSRGVKGAALLSAMYVATDAILRYGWTAGRWGSRNCGWRCYLRPYGGICVLQAC